MIKVNEVYNFTLSPTNKTRYLLDSFISDSNRVSEIPFRKDRKSGRAWISFDKNRFHKKSYTHGFYLGKLPEYPETTNFRLTGVNIPENAVVNFFCIGDSKSLKSENLLIFQFSENKHKLSLYVIYNAAANAEYYSSLYEQDKDCVCLANYKAV